MKIWRDYRVTIPKKLRDEYGFVPGTEVRFVTKFGMPYLKKVPTPGSKLQTRKKRRK